MNQFHSLFYYLSSSKYFSYKRTKDCPKTDRKSGVTKREFYSAIPMERWQEKKESMYYEKGKYRAGSEERYNNRRKEKNIKSERSVQQPSNISSGQAREQQQAISDINRRYKARYKMPYFIPCFIPFA